MEEIKARLIERWHKTGKIGRNKPTTIWQAERVAYAAACAMIQRQEKNRRK